MKMGWFDLAYSTAWSGGECFFWHLEIILLFSRWCNRFSQLWQLSKHNIRVNGIPGDDGKIDIRWSLAFRCVTLAEKNSILLTLSLGKNVCTTQSRALYCTVLLYVTQMAAELRPILPWSIWSYIYTTLTLLKHWPQCSTLKPVISDLTISLYKRDGTAVLMGFQQNTGWCMTHRANVAGAIVSYT